MKLDKTEERYVAKLKKNLATHNRRRWWSVIACAFGAGVCVLGWLFLRFLVNDLTEGADVDALDMMGACMATAVLYPKLLIYSMSVGALLGYIITHWRPDPAKSLLLKIVDELNKDGEQKDPCD